MKSILFTFGLLVTFNISVHAQWDASAGVIKPYSGASSSSSTGTGITNTLDGNLATAWQSAAPFPSNYINRSDQNVLKNRSVTASPSSTFLSSVTDANINTYAHIDMPNSTDNAWAQIDLPTTDSVRILSVKLSLAHSVAVFLVTQTGEHIFVDSVRCSQDYQLIKYTPFRSDIQSIRLESIHPFLLYEVAATSKPPREWVTVNLQQPRSVGWIHTKHWAGTNVVSNTRMYVSTDNTTWTQITTLDPTSLSLTTTRPTTPLNVQYIKMEHQLLEKDWAKCFVWEISAYDANGPFAAMASASPNPNTLNDMVGVNGIWGWGWNSYSNWLPATKGPAKFAQVASHARNYHSMIWDVTDPDITPNYIAMGNGSGTQAQWWLNWNQEYNAWQSAGLPVQASIAFLNDDPATSESAWNTPYQSAYNYGYAFARYFGPTYGNGLVRDMEVGNEPWDYSASFYSTVLQGMAKGAKDADPAMRVFSGALQAGDPLSEVGMFKNYAGIRISQQTATYLDGFNSHAYAFTYESNGIRRMSYPEHPESGLRWVLNDIRFRDVNMPGKKFYLSEFGWDSDGAGESCTHSECVTEANQAMYILRSIFWFSRLGIDRTTVYFHTNNNNTTSSLFERCGITGSITNSQGALKKSYVALQALRATVGAKKFLSVLQENDQAWAYVFGDNAGTPTHMVVWRPVDGSTTGAVQVNLSYPGYTATAAKYLSGNTATGETTAVPTVSAGVFQVNAYATPTVITLAPLSGARLSLEKEMPLAAATSATLQAYPNPTKDYLILSWTGNSTDVLHTQLIDPLGRIIRSSRSIRNWNVGDLPRGLYILKWQNLTSGQSGTKQLLMQ